MIKRLRIVTAGATAFIVGSASILCFPFTAKASISNNDPVVVTVNGGAWTNGSVQNGFSGLADNITIGGNTVRGVTSTKVPVIEVADQQAMNGYGPGDYLFIPTSDPIISGNGANPVWISQFLRNYGFTLTDQVTGSQPYYAASDVYNLSGWYAGSNPSRTNPYWFKPGSNVPLEPYTRPSVQITSVSNYNNLVPGSTVTVKDTNNDPNDDTSGNPDNVPKSTPDRGLIAVWYFDGTGKYENAFSGISSYDIPAYGFTPWSGTYQPGSAAKTTFNIPVPSDASGKGALYLYYVDGADRFAEAHYNVQTASLPSISLSASPSRPQQTGTSVHLTAETGNITSSDTIKIKEIKSTKPGTFPNGATSYTWTSPGTFGSYGFNQYVKSSTAQTVTYEATIYDANNQQTYTSNPVSVEWTAAPPPPTTPTGTPTVTLTASPQNLTINQSSALTATATNSSDYIKIVDTTGLNTLSGSNAASDGIDGESVFGTSATANIAETATYEAELINPTTGTVDATSTPVSVTWVPSSESIVVTASPTQLDSGEQTTITYNTTDLQPGDSVMLVGIGENPPMEQKSSSPSNTYFDIQNPENGASTTVYYSAEIVNSQGQNVANSNGVAVTWKSTPPVIHLSAARTLNQPDQPDQIMFGVTGTWGQGDYVTIKGTGGNDMWSDPKDSAPYGTFTEVENPNAGQTINVTYQGTVYDASGNEISTASITVQWTNSWTGSLNINANPTELAIQTSTTLTTTLSEPLPSGYTLSVWNATSGKLVDSTSQAGITTFQTNYSEFNPATDTFYSFVSDPYEHLGTPSNDVSVTWSELSLSASPAQLPAGQRTTLSVTAASDLPSGDYLIIENTTTGQILGSSLGNPFSVNVSESTAQNDTFEAFMSTTDSVAQQFVESPPQTVDWYTVQFSATPTRLPVNNATLLHASAANIPSGYVLTILDRTNGTTVATGQPGQNDLQAYVTKQNAETDQFQAEVVQPGNPTIPELQVPGYVPPHGTFSITANSIYYLDPTTNQWSYVTSVPNQDGPNSDGIDTNQQFMPVYGIEPVFDPQNNSIYVWFSYYIVGPNGSYGVDEVGLWAFNMTMDTWQETSVTGDDFAGNASNFPVDMIYDNQNGQIYLLEMQGMYGDQSLYDYNPSTNQQSQISMGYSDYYYSWARHRNIYTGIYGPEHPLGLDQQTGTVYAASGNYMYTQPGNGGYLYLDLSNGNTGAFNTVPYTYGTFGAEIGYDPSNGWMYFYNSNYEFGGGPPDIVGYDPTTNTIKTYNITTPSGGDLGQGAFAYDPANGDFYIQVGNGGGDVYEFNPTSGSFNSIGAPPSGTSNVAYSLFFDGDRNAMLAEDEGTGQLAEYTGSTWVNVGSATGNADGIYVPPHGAPTGTVKEFPYWTFSQMPTYVPNSLFTQTAANSAEGHGFWVDGSASPMNGTAWFESSFTTGASETVTISAPGGADDNEIVWVDGQPVLQTGDTSGSMPAGAPNTSTTSVTLPAGPHQVIVEASNTNGFNNPSPNGAAASVQVTAGGQTLVADQGNNWTTTGYVTQLPAGFFSGAIGTYNFNEYVMGEAGTPVTQSASYSVTTPAQNVALQSQTVPVTWYAYGVDISANPTSLVAGQSTTLNVNSTLGMPNGSVLRIIDTTTGATVGSSASGATTYTTTYARSTKGTEEFIGEIIDPTTGQVYAQTDPVAVTWTQTPLTLSGAMVTHTPHWLSKLQSYNSYYSSHNASLVRPVSDFWAGEQLDFQVTPSISTISQAYVTLSGLQFYNQFFPDSPPVDFQGGVEIPLTYNSVTGDLEGHTDPSWEQWFAHLKNGTYTVTFFVKTSDGQVGTAAADFTINQPWVSGADSTTYYHQHQSY